MWVTGFSTPPHYTFKKKKKETPKNEKMQDLAQMRKNVTVFIKCSYLSGKVFLYVKIAEARMRRASSEWNTEWMEKENVLK